MAGIVKAAVGRLRGKHFDVWERLCQQVGSLHDGLCFAPCYGAVAHALSRFLCLRGLGPWRLRAWSIQAHEEVA